MWRKIADYVPNDNPQQIDAKWVVKRVLSKLPDSLSILDVGCGEGNSIDFFRKQMPSCFWVGVDISDSPEAKKRQREDAVFMYFDGVNVPLLEKSLDLGFCKQVLEHVRHPEALLRDASRVLKKGGYFVGSTSHLEPYHSFYFGTLHLMGSKRPYKMLDLRSKKSGRVLTVSL